MKKKATILTLVTLFVSRTYAGAAITCHFDSGSTVITVKNYHGMGFFRGEEAPSYDVEWKNGDNAGETFHHARIAGSLAGPAMNELPSFPCTSFDFEKDGVTHRMCIYYCHGREKESYKAVVGTANQNAPSKFDVLEGKCSRSALDEYDHPQDCK